MVLQLRFLVRCDGDDAMDANLAVVVVFVRENGIQWPHSDCAGAV